MLPKVATHILHTTSRAAAQAVQTPLRNVFQTGHSTGSNIGNRNGPGSSNWGGNGTGTGSSKQNTGSRYYSSFGTAGRAVSQANAVSANVDGTFSSDETDEHVSRRVIVIQSQSQSPPQASQSKRPRIRSSSVSLTKAESLGVLKTLQLQGRSRFLHTAIEAASQASQEPSTLPLIASRPRRNSTSSSDGLDRPSSPARHFTTATIESGSQAWESPSLRPRRNSTSSADGLDRLTLEPPKPIIDESPQSPRLRRNSTSSIDDYERSDVSSIETKPTTPPQSPRVSRPATPAPKSPKSSPPAYRFEYLVEAKRSGDPHRVAEAVARFRSTAKDTLTQDFNIALEALYVTREGESVIPMLDAYNDMLKRSIQPDDRTYSLLILALSDRDYELGRTIKSLSDLKRRTEAFGGGMDGFSLKSIQDRIEILTSEHNDNFASVMSLFYAARLTAPVLSVRVYLNLMRTCVFHSNVDAAIEVFRHAEKLHEKMWPSFYRLLIQVYGNSNNVAGAEKAFQQYVNAGREGKVFVEDYALDYQKKHILCWNAMVEAYFRCGLPDKAVGLLDQMMNSPAGLDFGVADTPHPASSTYTTVLKGFCEAGDIQTAWTWYERLLEQGVQGEDPFWPSNQPIKPDSFAASIMIEALAERGRISELNKIYSTLNLSHPEMQSAPLLVYKANMRVIQDVASDRQAKGVLEFLTAEVLPRVKKVKHKKTIGVQIALEYLRRGLVEDALTSYAGFFGERMQEIKSADANSETPTILMVQLQASFVEFQNAFWEVAVQREALTFEQALTVLRWGQFLGVEVPRKMQKHVLHVYAVMRVNNQLPVDEMVIRDWEQFLMMAVDVEGTSVTSPTTSAREYEEVPGYAFEGVLSLVGDLARLQIDIKNLASSLMNKTIRHLISVYGPNHVIGAFQNFGPAFQGALENSEELRTMVAERNLQNTPENGVRDERTQRLTRSYGNLVVSAAQTKSIEEALRHNNVRSDVLAAFARLQQGLEHRKVPAPRILGKLIQGLGRQGDIDKVKEVYAISQEALKGLEMQQDALREGWICVEDSMIIALAHAGDVDNAHVHRLRIMEHGSAPSADAYGALILYVKDTTDDASNAMMLYREAQQANVDMNIYLYNNIISKLAKARKADHALEMFHRMKAEGVKPSSITYGALIGACARVGDVQSAETLFAEMVEQRNFKPRVPPYNTMMQLYTMTKPNRERALWFYEQMGAAGVRPTAHTYKLLLDAYGSIEPVDIASMEAVFAELQKDTHVDVQGTHYASLINAYGCIQRDLDKAIAVFDSVPASASLKHAVLDAVVFESVINVLVSHRRTDLIPEYINKMTAAGVHMTAYIANFLIKGYAIVGELDKAREIFESLIDPPTGVAAPNNHAPHDPSIGNAVGCMEPVYREPSTWEAMVRAELGAGYRDCALGLLQRLKARQYPEAVYNRISGVMVDHSSLLA